MWSLWLYLWAPLATAGLWLLGVNLAYTEAAVIQDMEQFAYTLLHFVSVLAIIIGVQYSWSLYNFLRFRKKIRRNFAAPIKNIELAVSAGLSERGLSQLQSMRQVDVSHDQAGNMLEP